MQAAAKQRRALRLERARQLMEARTAEQRVFVERAYTQQFMNGCNELLTSISKKLVHAVADSRQEQVPLDAM